MGLIPIAGAHLKELVRAAGVEPTTFGSGNRRLVHLATGTQAAIPGGT